MRFRWRPTALGRLLEVLGNPLEDGPPLSRGQQRPILITAPPLTVAVEATSILPTGINGIKPQFVMLRARQS